MDPLLRAGEIVRAGRVISPRKPPAFGTQDRQRHVRSAIAALNERRFRNC